MSDSKWFHRGREARRLKQPRQLPDGRIAARHRTEWYEGYDEQARQMVASSAPEATKDEARRVVAKLKEFARTL